MSANRADDLEKNLSDKAGDVQLVHRTALATCLPFKEKYDQCFNWWYRNQFLRGNMGVNRCDDIFDEYRACLIETVHAKGMSHLELFGPKPPK